jgi:protein-S-isoprenylcysteine O-methyltransferase Ste14
MFALFRAACYALLFVALVLVFLPARLLSWTGVTRPEGFGLPQAGGLLLTVLGALLAAWCVAAFAIRGRGTPAPFDPPRRLVTGGPYRFVRNPMYLGAGLALGGASLFYRSLVLLGYTALFFAITHVFILLYEEPALRRSFGDDYERYRKSVRRWLPGKGISREGV